ncbi:MAG: dihydrolipoyl dehydrogenase [Bdellovibrio sp.]
MLDVIFIGSGPGGYVGAIRAAQLGLKTAVVEKQKTFGGTCLNVGCIPSKALLESSEYYHQTQHELRSHGVLVSGVTLDLGTMMNRKSKIVKDFTGGIAMLFKKNKIESHQGTGRIVAPRKLEITDESGKKTLLESRAIVCATGSIPNELPFLRFDEKRVVSSTGALSLERIPKTMTVIGGGVIGLEMASVWSRLGSAVSVLEYAEQICPFMDPQIMRVLLRVMEKSGVKFITSAKVTGAQVKLDSIQVEYEDMKTKSAQSVESEVVLVSAGRKSFSQGLGLEELGVKKDSAGRVLVDSHFQTNIPGVYAIGDLIPGPMLAHKAEEEGVAVAEILAGQAGHVNYQNLPSVIYTFPEVASVGLTEEQAQAQGVPVAVGSFPFTPNGRARALGATDGLVKIVTDSRSDKIIGGHIVGPRASELLGEIVIAMEFGGSSEDLARSFHAHPTLNEVVREAALAVSKRARQM